MINANIITKCVILVPISCQLPSTLIKKKKMIDIMSVITMTTKNNPRTCKQSEFCMALKAQDTINRGISILMNKIHAITKGLNIVMKLFTAAGSNEFRLAMLPVPKKARNINNINMNEIRTWSIVSDTELESDIAVSSVSNEEPLSAFALSR